MDIDVERIVDDAWGGFKNRWPTKLSISDETILAIGKRYFELASGKEPDQEAESAKSINSHFVILTAAEMIKRHCTGRACANCEFSFVNDNTKDLSYGCCIHENTRPDQWRLPPKPKEE